MASPINSLKSVALISLFSFLFAIPNGTNALNLGIQADGSLSSFNKGCSRTCESKFCGAPPFLRYGKYCGILYSGYPGEQPCDGLDACCMRHDHCIQIKGSYLSKQCDKEFLNCVTRFMKSGAPMFKGNTCIVEEVIQVINKVLHAALVTGKVIDKP